MGLFNVFVEAAKQAAVDTAKEMVNNQKQGVSAIDGRTVNLSSQGALLLSGLLMAKAGTNEKSRAREMQRLLSIDRKNGNTSDFKEVIAVSNIKFNSIDESFDYWFKLIGETLKTELEKLTVMTNLVDIALVDGELDDEEQVRLFIFAEVLDISEDHMENIITIIAAKNNHLSGKI